MAAVTDGTLTVREYDGPVGESAEGARIEHGYDAANVLRTVTATFFGERGYRQVQYSIAQAGVFTMTVNDVSYARPISPERPTEDGSVTTSYFMVCDGEVLKAPTDAAKARELTPFITRLPEFSGTP
ncbi:MAG: hypothetical protein AB8G16_13905 [Gammaproteobacteria bacterium]